MINMLSTIQNHLFRNLILFTVAGLLLTSCDDNGTGPDNESVIEVHTVTDLQAFIEAEEGEAPEGPQFTFYSLVENEIVAREDSASDNWDIAFAGTTILINSGTSGPGEAGAVLLDVPFEAVVTAPTTGYTSDSEADFAVSGWYNYTAMSSQPFHAVLPYDDKTIVLKTADGNYYVKLQILSYYQGNPDTSTSEFANTDTRPESRYYTFRYAIQLDGSTTLE